VGDLGVEVGVHDPGVRVRPLQAGKAALQQRVVVVGEAVVAPEAAVAVIVGGVGGAVEGEVDGEAADGQDPRHHHVDGAAPDDRLQAADELADDPGHVPPHLRHGPPGEERRVVVVAAELAHHEQRLGQVALAVVPAHGGQQLPEPLDLGVEWAVVPDLVAQADGVEEVEAHGGGADDGHVRALLEVAAGLGRRRQRKPKVLGCMHVYTTVPSQSSPRARPQVYTYS